MYFQSSLLCSVVQSYPYSVDPVVDVSSFFLMTCCIAYNESGWKLQMY